MIFTNSFILPIELIFQEIHLIFPITPQACCQTTFGKRNVQSQCKLQKMKFEGYVIFNEIMKYFLSYWSYQDNCSKYLPVARSTHSRRCQCHL